MSKGYVYILSNETMPGLLKIGKTTRDVNWRANELYQTGVPTPFRVEYSVLSPDCDELEMLMHGHLADARVSPGREFFKLDLATAEDLLDEILMAQVEDWVADFVPDHAIVNPDTFVDVADLPRHVIEFAIDNGLAAPEVADIIRLIDVAEFSPIIPRYVEMRERLRAERKAENLRVVGEE